MSDKKSLYDEGLNLFGQQKHIEAIEKYNQALELDPNDAEIYMAVSMSYQQMGDMEKAIEYAEKAVELQPEEPLYHTNLSRVYQRVGRIQDAEDAMARSRQLSMG